MTRTIRGLLLGSATVLATVLFGLGYFTFLSVHERTIREDAVSDARLLARLTFNSMFQLMSTGWSRAQLGSFIDSVTQAAEGSPASIAIYRGDLVTAVYGPIEQPPADHSVIRALASGQPFEAHSDDGVRFVFPLIAQELCLRCHPNAQIGSVLGAITVNQSLEALLDDNRQRFTLRDASGKAIGPVNFCASASTISVRPQTRLSVGK